MKKVFRDLTESNSSKVQGEQLETLVVSCTYTYAE